MNRILDALRFSWRALLQRREMVIAPVNDGQAAFVVSAPIVTVVTGTPSDQPLERLQARRSRLVYAADRPTAVAFALRWRLDLSRIRLVPGGVVTEALAKHDLDASTGRAGSWHST